MSRLAVNVVANLVGQGWSVLLSLVVVPLYLRLLGIEAYGLIGFYVMLQGLAQVLDLGLSPTMNREMARYWAIGIGIGTGLVLAAPFIARHWLQASVISEGDVRQALMLMGLLVALQWP